MINITIDGRPVTGRKGQSILDIAASIGIEIPTLCHDPRVKTYGSCGICVVEVEGARNLIRSCATEAQDGMRVHTSTERVRRSRKMTLELLLSDHTGDCRPPCSIACPAGTDCQGYVGLIANGQASEALMRLKESYPLPLSIGLVCPHPCEDACRRQMVEKPIAIADLKAFAANFDLKSHLPYLPAVKEATGKKVAVVGSGPAGLTAAYFLTREGHQVVVYESMPLPGGMLRYGIPEYRLPKAMLDREIELIRRLGVTIITDTRIPDDITLADLREKFDAVFLGIGAWRSTGIGCSGEDEKGVLGGIEFLWQVAMHKTIDIGPRVAVVGGGNTAMDAARTAVRLGASEVAVIYRRTRAEMPAEDIEIAEAEEEGVIFRFLAAPEQIVAENGVIKGLQVQKMRLGEPDASGRRSPLPTGEVEFIEADTIIAAIGQQVEPRGLQDAGLSRKGTFHVDDDMATSIPGVFAGGDAVTGPGIAIEAVAQGQKAARAIHHYLNGVNDNQTISDYRVEKTVVPEEYAALPAMERLTPWHAPAAERRTDFRPVKQLFTDEEAVREASRCLECGCLDYYECRLIQYARQYDVNPGRMEGAKHAAVPIENHPFMIRDMNKCILCGLCVRICDEVVGATALGLVQRGFDTVVRPEFGLKLVDTACISCGQCVTLCPTGALVERSVTGKNVPLAGDVTMTTCTFCGMGCKQAVQTFGDTIIKVEPADDGLLCSRGRFAWNENLQIRVTRPMIKQNGQWSEASWEEAITHIVSTHQSIQKQETCATGVFASPSYTVEEAGAAGYIANGLGARYLSSFTRNAGEGLMRILGDNLSSNKMRELEQAEVILMIGSFRRNHIPAIRARQAVDKGAKLIIISQEESIADDRAFLRICPEDNNIDLLLQILSAVINRNGVTQNYLDQSTSGYEELRSRMADKTIGETAARIADCYAQAARVLILVDGYSTSIAAVQVLSNLAVVSGHIGSLANGIIVIGPGGDATGVWQAGFKQPRKDILAALEDGGMHSIIVLGEDPVGCGIVKAEILRKAKLVVVMTPFLHDTAQLADVVLPGSLPFETNGTFVSADGSLRLVQQVQRPPAGVDNLEIFEAFIRHMNLRPEFRMKVLPGGKWSKPLHYEDGFAYQDGRAHLSLPEFDKIFVSADSADTVWYRFLRKLEAQEV